jgi:hypothetical protein
VLEVRRVRNVRAATQVDERAIRVCRDHFVFAQVGDPLQLQRIIGEAT